MEADDCFMFPLVFWGKERPLLPPERPIVNDSRSLSLKAVSIASTNCFYFAFCVSLLGIGETDSMGVLLALRTDYSHPNS